MKNLSILIEHAGEATSPPPPPPEGIPRQKIPDWIRFPIRVVFLPLILLDLFMQRIAALLLRTPFRKEGKCLKRGNCCHYVMLHYSKGFWGKMYFLWNTEIHGFYLREKEPQEYEGKQVLVMGCRYLKKDGSCGVYSLRPAVCRKWPMIEYFGYPRMLKGCGFRAVPRSSTKP